MRDLNLRWIFVFSLCFSVPFGDGGAVTELNELHSIGNRLNASAMKDLHYEWI